MIATEGKERFKDLEVLSSYLGDFWTSFYADGDSVLNLLRGSSLQQRQLEQTSQELVLLQGRQDSPVTASRLQLFWTISRSSSTDGVTYPGPAGLKSATQLADLPTAADRVLTCGLDFQVDASNNVIFARNPFDTFRGSIIRDSGEDVLRLYFANAEIDNGWDQLAWSAASGVSFPSTTNGHRLNNAVLDAYTSGTSWRSVLAAVSALTDVPFAAAHETVQEVCTLADCAVIITDQNAYRISRLAAPLVAAGAVLNEGQELCDAVRIAELQSSALPSWLASLTLTQKNLWSNVTLTFTDAATPLVVQTGVSGFTKVSFALGGDPGEVASFFAELHTRGVAAGKTLANWLDIRPLAAQTTQPAAVNLPATINPLRTLVDFVLQGSTVVLRYDTAKFGPNAVGGLLPESLLASLLSPHTRVLVA